MIVNPITKKQIKIGGSRHTNLVQRGILGRETLDIGKVEIIDGSRQKRSVATIEYFASTTHWTNIDSIANDIGCSIFCLIEWFTKEFDEMKVCYNKETTRIIFPGRECFINETIIDFVNANSEKYGLDLTFWNQ